MTDRKVITIRSSNGPDGYDGEATFDPTGKLLTSNITSPRPIVQLNVMEWKQAYPDEDPVGQTHDILDWGYWVFEGVCQDLIYEPPSKGFRDEIRYQTWILNPDSSGNLSPDRYDTLEISPCLKREDHVEILHEAPEEERRGDVFWTLYGHIPGQGVEAIGDFASRGTAYQVAKRLGYGK